MKRLACLCAILLSIPSFSQTNTNFHSWAPTPPMGWNSWDCYGPTVTEAEVKANADYMAKHLKQSGWEYVVVDIRWFVRNDKAHGYNQANPDYVIDSFGRFLPAENRFPSSANGKGFKPLADYLHNKGLKFGIHIMRGVPVVAVEKNMRIKNTSLTAKDIYSPADQCLWLRDMYTIIPGKAGAQEYYNSIFELYASWGLDFVKVDDLSSPIYFTEEVEMIRKAIDRTGRKILLSTSPGETPVDHAGHVQQNANMWRTVGDFWDSWNQLKEHFDVFERWNKWRAPGAFPDGDMLPLGRIGIRAERGDPRFTNFTEDEQYLLMTLWSIFKSPMMFGGNLPDNDIFTNSLLTNKDVLYVLNKSTGNAQLFRTDKQVAWVADDPATGDKFLAVFNIDEQKHLLVNKAIWSSEIIDRKNQSAPVNIPLNGAKKLFLGVSELDNIDWDHADWLNPVVHMGNDSLDLTSIKWTQATSGWNKPLVNKAVSGTDLIVENKRWTKGIGTHAASVIEYDLPAGATGFTATVGLDKAGADQNTGGNLRFHIFTESPAGPAPSKSAPVRIDLSLLGGNKFSVKDLWTGRQLGQFTGTFSPDVNLHGARLFRLKKIN